MNAPAAVNRAPVVTKLDWVAPVPDPDSVSKVYFESCATGTLLVQSCPLCGNIQHYPRLLCRVCGADPNWLAASGRGVVYSFTIIRQFGEEPFLSMVPFVVSIIQLEEGPRMIGNIVDCDVEAVEIGSPVTVVMYEIRPGIAIPNWRLAGVG